ncbi:MAG: galactose mutarotase [Spirochaetaceae bacterium]|jgi:aldose 1-epimerase|nr:galactose mutarotase [Spirochaetaceae bacterium]
MNISQQFFGTLGSGERASLYRLAAGDVCLAVTDFGATWVSLSVPDAAGRADDVILGYSAFDGYTRNTTYQGATIGRVANRIGKAGFAIGGKRYALFDNADGNTLHGGRRGFDKRVWEADAYRDGDGVYVTFELRSPDGDEGFPGNLRATVTYGVTKDNEVRADYFAKVDAPSPVNLTNHAYFNLKGEGNGTILDHEAVIYGSSIVAVDEAHIPTGKINPVMGTPFDFSSRKPIGRDIGAAGGGYDHCYVVDGDYGMLRPVAEVYEPSGGRVLRLEATQPGVQFYTGNFLNGFCGKLGSVYDKHSGFCLETQHFPDSPNRPEFPCALFGPGRDYHEQAVFRFDVRRMI